VIIKVIVKVLHEPQSQSKTVISPARMPKLVMAPPIPTPTHDENTAVSNQVEIGSACLNAALDAEGVGVGAADELAFSPSAPDTFPSRVLSIAHKLRIDEIKVGSAVEASLGSASVVVVGSRNCV